MAKITKKELLAKGKEMGLNLNSKMTIYELEHRIKDAEEEAKAKADPEPAETKSSTKARGGEY